MRTRLITFALGLALTACADKAEEKPVEGKDRADTPRLVGRIASIPADRKFVLIQSYGTWEIATGSLLTTQGSEGRAANLRVTGEKLGQYAAADLQSGSLEVGDGVYTVTKARQTTDSSPAPAEPNEPPAAGSAE